jgi:hypothetical protein
MTILALVAGWNVGAQPACWFALFMTFSVVLGVMAQAAWLDRTASRWIWMVESGLAVSLVGVVALGSRVDFPVVALLVGALGITAHSLRTMERVNARVRLSAYSAHLAGACALAGFAPLLMAARGESMAHCLWAWGVLGVAFGSSVFFVQAVMPGKARSILPLAAIVLATLALVLVCQILAYEFLRTLLSVIPIFLRLSSVHLLRRTGLAWKVAGWIETVAGIWTVHWMIGEFG